MNKRIQRLLEPNMLIYFSGMGILSVLLFSVKVLYGVAGVALTAVLYLLLRRIHAQRRNQVMQYIETVSGGLSSAGYGSVTDAPFPIMVYSADSGEIVWANDAFVRVSQQGDALFDLNLTEAVPEYDGRWALEGKNECPQIVPWNGRDYQVLGHVSRSGSTGTHLLVISYWLDVTEKNQLRQEYEKSRPVVAILLLDNYEEVTKVSSEAAKSVILAKIDEQINSWASVANGLLCRYDRNRYLFIFQQESYDTFVEDRFSILDKLHEVTNEDGVMATLSIGVGKDAVSFQEAFRFANLSIEMALSRGGDQAVVKNSRDFEFYGGHNKSMEKRTKVKSRVIANALGELIADAAHVYVMGHRFADMDSLGAAAGICCVARKKGKKAQIVIDEDNNAVGPLLSFLRELPEYQGVFVSGSEAFLRAHAGSLLVVVDTNRPDGVESPQLLEACTRVAVIDHHRRAATYIENAALNFHEPYASSASELVTELLQYLVDPSEILHAEAGALLAGIVLDTKNFTMRTGGRTFEAAAFLRRAGGDTTEVHRLFQSDLKTVAARYDIVCQAKLYRKDIALSFMEEQVDRIAAAQAADEMLNLEGVRAAFVIYPQEETVYISGRSMGDVNVQLILEELGGGGNTTQAGVQLPNQSVDQVQQKLLDAIDKYFEE